MARTGTHRISSLWPRLWQRDRLSHFISTTTRQRYASLMKAVAPTPLILQEGDGERRLRRPGGPTGSGSVPEFIIKVDKQNGNAEDFYVGTEILNPSAMIPFHKHHNSEEVVILEEGGATVTVGDKRAVAGPHSIVFIPRETWVGITNTGDKHPRGLPVLASRF